MDKEEHFEIMYKVIQKCSGLGDPFFWSAYDEHIHSNWLDDQFAEWLERKRNERNKATNIS